jgi:hypothetical protein
VPQPAQRRQQQQQPQQPQQQQQKQQQPRQVIPRIAQQAATKLKAKDSTSGQRRAGRRNAPPMGLGGARSAQLAAKKKVATIKVAPNRKVVLPASVLASFGARAAANGLSARQQSAVRVARVEVAAASRRRGRGRK